MCDGHLLRHSDRFIQIAKGGEADDALKRVMLDFHTTQLVAQKQALLVLLSGKHSSKHYQHMWKSCHVVARMPLMLQGATTMPRCQRFYVSTVALCTTGDADYNDVVDAARVAGHKVHLFHSHAAAQTLRGNVDHCEAWHEFLARKSGQKVEDLEETGFVVRGASPTTKPSGVHLCAQSQACSIFANMPLCLHFQPQCSFRFYPDKACSVACTPQCCMQVNSCQPFTHCN